MPKNTKGGKNFKRGRKNRAPRSLILKDQNTAYAKVLANLGNGSCNLQIISDKGDEDQCLGHIRGKVVRLRFLKGDIVLVGFRHLTKTVDDSKKLEVDINHKYWPDQVQALERSGEIKKQEDYNGLEFGDEVDFTFEDDGDSDDEDEQESGNDPNGNLKNYEQVDYSNPMGDYEAPESEDEEEEELDKMGNTIVKPKKPKPAVLVSASVSATSNTVSNSDTVDSEEEVDKSDANKHNYKFNKSEEKKLAGVASSSQRAKMQKQLNRNKKSQINAQHTETDEGTINFDDV